MSGKVLNLDGLLNKDHTAVEIANQFVSWNNMRTNKISEWTEVRKYIFATDTTQTTNAQLPWKNKTTLPKLTQIRDNLHANYMKSLFPKRKWVIWEAHDKKSAGARQVKNIENYVMWMVERSHFKDTVSRLLLDWIDYGNCFASVDWEDERQTYATHNQVGYVGAKATRISPLDLVFNPIAENFHKSPKITRSLMSIGEIKEYLERESTDANKDTMEEAFKYLVGLRSNATAFSGELSSKDALFKIDGFNSFQAYLESNYVEVLTFFGDMYDVENNIFYRNHIITIADRHKLLVRKPNPSFFGRPNLYHCGWRIRQDNLWAMGPLDNLVGLQYRIDHLENLKADVFDLTAFPPLKIKGYVDDFTWGPFEKIFVGDEGDVEILSPDINALNANLEINLLEQKMEEMAGAPKEALGFRTPGEKTKYEVQRLENAASRIFQNKIEQFEEQIIEPLLNAMLELAQRNMPTQEIGIFNEEFNITNFRAISKNDITGNGGIRPVAAKHFAEKTEKIQNATAFFSSPPGMDPLVNVHMSGLKTAQMFEELLEIEGFSLVTPYIRVTEQAEAQRMMNTQDEQTMMEAQTPSGLTPDDIG